MAMAYPTMQAVNKNGEKIWRVTYAGMIREHPQEWQARVWFQEALQVYARDQAGQID